MTMPSTAGKVIPPFGWGPALADSGPLKIKKVTSSETYPMPAVSGHPIRR